MEESLLDALPDVRLVFCLTTDILTPLFFLPQKYEEAASYHDLNPHAFLFNEGPPFDGADDPNTRIVVAPTPRQSIDYSCFISGNPDAKLVPPAPTVASDAPPLSGSTFSLDPCADIADHTFHSSPPHLSSLLNWASFDMLTLDSANIAGDTAIYAQGGQSLDSVFASGIY